MRYAYEGGRPCVKILFSDCEYTISDSPFKECHEKVVTVTFTCKITKNRENKFLNIDVASIMKSPLYSVRSGVSVSVLKIPLSHIFVEIPGGMFTHVAVLNMKIHENSDFRPVFV